LFACRVALLVLLHSSSNPCVCLSCVRAAPACVYPVYGPVCLLGRGPYKCETSISGKSLKKAPACIQTSPHGGGQPTNTNLQRAPKAALFACEWNLERAAASSFALLGFNSVHSHTRVRRCFVYPTTNAYTTTSTPLLLLLPLLPPVAPGSVSLPSNARTPVRRANEPV
jgi:hypothetical protein